MTSAKEYFETYLSWKRSDSNLRSAPSTYEPFSAMELKTLQLEAEYDNPGAVEELGERYLFGLEVKQDVDKAMDLLKRAAQAGHPDAMQLLSEIFRTEEFGRQDYDKYFKALQMAAEGGSWKAQFNLSCAYYKGRDAYEGHGFDQNKAAAYYWSTKCAVLCMELLETYFTNNSADSFQEYMQGVYALFVQSILVSARQLIRGDGVAEDKALATSMLRDAQRFHVHYMKSECTDFTSLLGYCA